MRISRDTCNQDQSGTCAFVRINIYLLFTYVHRTKYTQPKPNEYVYFKFLKDIKEICVAKLIWSAAFDEWPKSAYASEMKWTEKCS